MKELKGQMHEYIINSIHKCIAMKDYLHNINKQPCFKTTSSECIFWMFFAFAFVSLCLMNLFLKHLSPSSSSSLCVCVCVCVLLFFVVVVVVVAVVVVICLLWFLYLTKVITGVVCYLSCCISVCTVDIERSGSQS